MAKISKSTKKTQSKHIKRHDNKLVKDQAKPKAAIKHSVKSDEENNNSDEVSVDDFLNGFEAVEKKASKKSKKSKKLKDESDNDSSSEEEEDMEATMATLSQQDPEFYEFLKENDKGLLDFAGSNPLDGVSDSDGEGETKNEDQEQEVEKTETAPAKIDLTLDLVKKWKTSLVDAPTLKLIRNIVTAFKVAVNLNKEDSIADFKYTVTDEKAFHELMFLTLRDLPVAIQKIAPYKLKKESRILPSGPTVTKLSSIMKSHAASMLILLNDINNTETAALVLYSVDQLLPFFLSHRRILKELIKTIVDVWATTRDVQTQIATFAFLHNSSKEFKKSILELVLKTTYSTFIKSCRKTNIRNMPLINFQKNSAAELFSIDEVLSYQVGFEFIRHLAINLRNGMAATTKKTSRNNSSDAYKLIYNWQYCHSLDFWSRVLSNGKATASQLKQLIYPLVQVTIGTIKLNPTPQYFPLRFYLIRSLIRLSQNTGVMIPVFPLLSEMLASTAFTKTPKKKDNLAAFDFDHNIKCNQAYLGTRVYQEGISEQFVDLIGEYFVLYCKSISFPEFSTPVTISLRRFIKTSTTKKLNRQLSNIVEKITNNSDYIEQRRADADFNPSDKQQVANFLKSLPWEETPLGSYLVVQREVRDEKVRLIRESLEEEDKEKEEQERKRNFADEIEGKDDSDDSEDEDVNMSD